MWSFFGFLIDNISRHAKAFVLGFCGFGSVYGAFFLNISDIDKSGIFVFAVKTLVGIIASVISGFIVTLIKDYRTRKQESKISNAKSTNDEQQRA